MKEKILYTIINMLLALSFGLIALVAGEAVGILMGLISFITILYGVYAFFEYGAGAGVIIVLIGVGLNGLSTEQTQKIAYIVAGVVIVLFEIYCFAAFGLHRTTFSRILGVLYPIAMILGAYGLVWKPSFENFLTLASGLWIVATIIDVIYWNGSPKSGKRTSPSSQRRSTSQSNYSSSSSSSSSSVRYSTQGDVDRAMRKVASRFSGGETCSTGMRTMSLDVKVEVSVWSPKVKFTVHISVHNAKNFYSQAEADSAQDALVRKFDEISSRIMEAAEDAFSNLYTKEDYSVDIVAGNVNVYD